MKINQKYLALSLITVIATTAMSLGTLSFAQTVTPLTCAVNSSSVGVNQAAILVATGGNGTYVWSGTNLNITNSVGNQFAVSYSSVGTYFVTVSSANTSATCTVNVVASTNLLSCFPATQNVTLGQTATVSASGGDNNYVWSAPDLNITNPNGTGFSASYASTGVKTLTVRSAGLVNTCAINVLSNGTPVTPVTPTLPNTGNGSAE